MPEYASVESDVDRMLGYSMRRLCLEDPDNRLRSTQYTQPALYVVNALHYYKALQTRVVPDFVAGHSLGEFNALLAAGVFDFMTGLRLVHKRGLLMSQSADGGMAAVLGLGAQRISGVLGDNGLGEVDLANLNSESQIVISGSTEAIKRAGPLLQRAGASAYVPLQVSAAFHSRHMADAAREFAEFLAPLAFAAPRVPVLSNVTARPYPMANASDAVKQLLVRQITHPVRWAESVRHLLARGATDLRELGPGKVLSRLTQQIVRELPDEALA